MDNLEIRDASPEDNDLVASFIRDIAKFERLLGEANPDPLKLHEQLRPDANPPLRCFIAEIDGKPVGFALYFFRYSSFLTNWGMHLEDLYVHEAHRGGRIAGALMLNLAKFAVERGCKRLDFEVLKWNQRAIDVYKHWGAIALEEWIGIRLDEQALKKLASHP